MIMTTPPTRSRSVQRLFEALHTADIQTILFDSEGGICCSGVEHCSADLLIRPDSLPAFTRLLATHGFYRVATCRSAGTSVIKYLGYCECCEKLMRFNVSTEVTVGSLSGNHLVLRHMQGLYECFQQAGASKTSHVVETVSCVCAASLLYEYKARSRHRLLLQAREAFKHCDVELFQETSESLVGAEATRHILKLVDTFVGWEVDMLLDELWRVLEKAQEVDYNPGRLLLRKADSTQNEQRLTCGGARIRRAPIVVVTDANPASDHAAGLHRLLSSTLNCRLVAFHGIDHNDHNDSQQHSQDLVQPGIAQVCGALYTAVKNYLKFRKSRSLAQKGIVTIIPGLPVLDFPDLFNVPRLKFLMTHSNLLWRLGARAERRIYEKISAAAVDCLLIVHSVPPAAKDASTSSFEKRRRTQAIKSIPIKATRKLLVNPDNGLQVAQAQMVEQVLMAAADR
ncbi:MAG: hypothetical protein AAF404_16730 [Pseudomonadota bacterium]